MKIKTQEIKKGILKSLKSKNEEKKSEITELPEIDEDDDDDASLDSDQELQLAFKRKQLTPGLNIQLDKPKEFVNDEEGLKRKLKDFYLDMDWIERMDITVAKNSISLNDLQTEDGKIQSELADNDFKRESLFIRQAEAAINLALPKLQASGVETSRPNDYFAEMAKSDEHMKRIRENLLSKHAELEKREKIRKLREMKKMGKQIQMEVEKKKQQAKKNLSESIKKFKKGDKESLKIELEGNHDKKGKKRKSIKMNNAPNDDDDQDFNKRMINKENKFGKPSSKKANFKDKKYGFGGRKKRSKYNTAESYAEGYGQKSNKKFSSSKGKFNNNKKDKKFINKNKPKNR